MENLRGWRIGMTPANTEIQIPAVEDLRLRYFPDPVLRQRAAPVGAIDAALVARVRRMFEIMYEHHGIGLAAPQVGALERVFVVNLTADREQPEEERVYINPQISSPEGECTQEEGCLSFPEIRLDVVRPERVQIRATDLEGEQFEESADGWLARCVQHEFDHLDGILFVGRVPIARRLMVRKQLKELERKYRDASK